MKFLLIIDSLGSGGAERQCVVLALALKKEGHDVYIYGYTQGNHFKDEVYNAGISYNLIDIKNPFSRIIKFRKEIKKLNPEVIIAFLQTSAILAELASMPLKKWKLIVSERNNISHLFSFRTRIVMNLHRRADIITTNSLSSTDAVIKRAPFLKNRIRTIYNGLDLTRFIPANNYAPSRRFKLVVISSHQEHKNARNLILAISQLKKQKFSFLPQIDWYGSDVSYTTGVPCETYVNTRNLIESLGLENDFILKEPVHEIVEVYQQADGLVLSSFWEGLPNAVCEAMACGLPILMSKVSDYEILTEGNGSSFDPASVGSIADSISWFCQLNPADIVKMRMVSRKKAEGLFSLELMSNSYLKLAES